MNFQMMLENVNEGSVLICFCLFWWLMLIGARADNMISIPYWTLFLPLWLWKFVVFLGWLLGIISWLRQRRSLAASNITLLSSEDPTVPYIQAISVSTFFTILLACSEVLLCIQLSVPSVQFKYLTILTPLLLVGLLGIFGFIFVMIDSRSHLWTQRHRSRRRRPRSSAHDHQQQPDPYYDVSVFPARRPRFVCSFTLELCIGANLLQLLCLIARLDHWIRSKWVVTFIPSFILLGMIFLFCVASFLVALVRYFTAYFLPIEQRRLPLYYYVSHIFINFLLCTSIILLVLRLDDPQSYVQVSYSLICSPVLLSLIIYTINSCCFGPGNPWWFGLNQNVLVALFESCPALQLCANTSVNATGFCKSADTASSDTDVATPAVQSNVPYEAISGVPVEAFYPYTVVFYEHVPSTAVTQASEINPNSFASPEMERSLLNPTTVEGQHLNDQQPESHSKNFPARSSINFVSGSLDPSILPENVRYPD